MIFVTVGSTQIPFARLIRALDRLPGEELSVQHGPVPPPPEAAAARAFMEFPEVIEGMEAADVVICHAGAGSILCALRAGHTPVVVPRLERYGETVDDHQLELARALAADGRVISVEDPARLAAAVAGAPPRRPRRQSDELLPIQVAVREAIGAGAPSLV
ncbi:MAG TPA: glycosyltransferase [Solirubrobacterales bacterium]|nr:glycosyltransferase [Solirubrobacterales bacterium]